MSSRDDGSRRPLPKVFQIGFNKCATKSIAHLFRGSGHRALHWKVPGPRTPAFLLANMIQMNRARGNRLLDTVDDFGVYTDMEANRPARVEGFRWFADLDAQYPGSKFILNVRDKDAWIDSRLSHGNGTYAERARRLLGLESLAELAEQWRRDWDMHIGAVEDHFADRPGDLVRFDIDHDPPELLAGFFADWSLDAGAWRRLGATSVRSAQAVRERGSAFRELQKRTVLLHRPSMMARPVRWTTYRLESGYGFVSGRPK